MTSKLAELYIEFTTKGYAAVDAVVSRIYTAMTNALGAATRLGSAGLQVAGGFAGVTAAAAGLVGMAAAISHGTVEGERLSGAMEILGRVVNDALAPYVRILTAGILSLAKAYYELDPVTKQAVAAVMVGVAVFGAAAAGAVSLGVAAAGIISGVSAVVGLFGALASALAMPLVLLAAVGAAGVAVAAAMGVSWSDLTSYMGSAFQKAGSFILDSIEFIAVGFAKLCNKMVPIWRETTDFIAMGLLQAMVEVGAMTQENAIEQRDMMKDATRQRNKTPVFDIDALKAGLAAGRAEIGAFSTNAGGMLSGLLGKFQGLFGKMDFGKGFSIRADVKLEGVEDTYKRLLTSFANDTDGVNIQKAQLNAANEANGFLQNIGKQLELLLNKPGAVTS